MKKFKNISNDSRFKKYIVNVPKDSSLKKDRIARDQLIRHTINSISNNKTMDAFHEQSLNNGQQEVPSVRSSIKRVQSKKLDRVQVMNRQLTKETIRKIKKGMSEEEQVCYEKNIKQLKEYIQTATKTCNFVINQQRKSTEQQQKEIRKQQNKRFLMNQLSFTQIDEQKIQQQKIVLLKFEHLKGRMSSKVMMKCQEVSKKNEQKIMSCLKMIDRLYRCMQEMQKLGYNRKSNKYIITHCINSRIWMTEVFLQESNEMKQNYSLEFRYFVVSTAEQVKINFTSYIAKIMCKDMNIIEEDVERLLDHVEFVFGQKKLMELSKVSEYIENKLTNAKFFGKQQGYAHIQYANLRVQNIDNDKINFTADLKRIEQKFGNMKQISKVSRRRYDDLNKTYERLQTLI